MYPPPPPPAQPTPPARKRPWWRATWALLAGGAIIGLVIGAGAGAAGQPQAEPAPTVTARSTVTATATATVTATPTVVQTVATHVQTLTVTYTPPVKIAFGDGIFRVGSEVAPGTYHTDGGTGHCYYERDRQGDGIDAIIANDNLSGPATIDVRSTDFALKTDGGCQWTKVG